MTNYLTRLTHKERLFRVLTHIQRDLEGDLDLDSLAEVACFSRFHFHRIFRAMIGETVSEHVRRLRLERAARQLLEQRQTVLAIALEAGYESHAAFTRAFKQWSGNSPRDFRRTSGPIPRKPGQIPYGAIPDPDHYLIPELEERMIEVVIRKEPPRRVAFLRNIGPYDSCGPTWDLLLTEMGRRGWLGGQSQMLGICHDDPDETPAAEIRYDACVTVDDRFEPFDAIGVCDVAGGTYAVATHIGPYSELGKTYSALFGTWLDQSGRELRSEPAFECYLTDPDNTEPEEMVTEIYVPLEES